MSRDAVMEQKMAVLGFVMLVALLKYPYYFTASSIHEHKVLLTDSESELGQEIALQYAKCKTKLWLVARNESAIRGLADRCLQAGALEVHTWSGDLSDAGQRERLVDEVDEKFGGKLNQIVMNHFLGSYEAATPWDNAVGQVATLDRNRNQRHLKDVERMMSRHFDSYVDLASRTVPLLTKTKGCLGVVIPLVGKVPVARLPGYSASIAAMTGFFQALRQELWQKRQPVSVTTIALGSITAEDGSGDSSLGKGYPFAGGWLSASTSLAADQILDGVSLKKTEMTYPFVSQVQYAIYAMLPSMYEGQFSYFFS